LTFNHHAPQRRYRVNKETIRDIHPHFIERSAREKHIILAAPCDNKRRGRDRRLALISIKELARWHLMRLRQDSFELRENRLAGQPSQLIAKVHRRVVLERTST
jgi:hypothetical protein